MRSFRCLFLCLALVLCLHSVAAVPATPVRRQNNGPSDQTPAASTHDNASSRPSATVAPSGESSRPKSDQPSEVSVKASATSSSVIQAPVATATSQLQSTSSADADAKDPLPIHPKLTPALGISGVLLLLTGVVYTIIGIRNKWVYVFGSAAYLTTLAVTVLIIYLMSPPVSNAIQGAFFVAALFTGLVFGVLSLVFSDITEGFGCLLGGFCLSMWFLSLKDGGLIPSVTGRAIFIGCMSAGGYSLSFSHYTRNHGLIASIAFSGATVTVLGIDCLARAGWKEFWLYLWNLNDDIFPLNTNTYPVTKRIKAELAGVIIITVLGVVSQMRVWKLVKEHRAKSAAQELEKQQDQDREEELLGRKIEDNLQKERAQWEATYGGQSVQDSSMRSSFITPKVSTSIRDTDTYGNDSVEMVNLSKAGVQRPTNTDTPSGTTVTVSVLNDDIQHIDGKGNPFSSSAVELGEKSQANTTYSSPSNTPSPTITRRTSLRPSGPPPPPAVIPLPFTIPKEQDTKDDEDKTSVSAVPETYDEAVINSRPVSKRVSDMSAVRQRISRNIYNGDEATADVSHMEADRASSVAATLDDDHDKLSLRQLTPPHSPLLGGEHGASNDVAAIEAKDFALLASNTQHPLNTSTNLKAGDSLKQPSSLLDTRTGADILVPGTKDLNEGQQARSPKSDAPMILQGSQIESTESPVTSLKDGMLLPKLSKVALSYRTNEWAKHLETAEKPEVEELATPTAPRAMAEETTGNLLVPVDDDTVSPLVSSKRSSRRASAEKPYKLSGSSPNVSNPAFSRESLVEQHSLTRSPPVVSPATISRSSSANRLDSLSPLSSNTLMSQRESLMKKRVSSQSLTPNSSSANLLADDNDQEDMTLAQRRQMLQKQTSSPTLQHQTSVTSQRKVPPSISQKWQNKGWALSGAPAGFNSHQPKRTSSSQSNQKREELYAGWRESMQNVAPPQNAAYTAEQQRMTLMNERRQKKLEKQQREAIQQQRSSQMESMMRSGQMLEAHREAMRRMQANASKGAQ